MATLLFLIAFIMTVPCIILWMYSKDIKERLVEERRYTAFKIKCSLKSGQTKFTVYLKCGPLWIKDHYSYEDITTAEGRIQQLANAKAISILAEAELKKQQQEHRLRLDKIHTVEQYYSEKVNRVLFDQQLDKELNK